MGLTPPPVNQL